MATSDVHMIAHSLREPLSAEALLHDGARHMGSAPGGAITVAAAERALNADGQPLEVEWPYGPPTPTAARGPCDTRWYGVLQRTTSQDKDEIFEQISRNRPLLLVLRLTDEFYDVVSPWIIRATGKGHALHAVVAAGAGTDSNASQHFLIRNSWGTRWADHGYAWIEAEYLNQNLIEWCVINPLAK